MDCRCPGNCLVHLHTGTSYDWLRRRLNLFKRYVSPDGTHYFMCTQSNNELKIMSPAEVSTVHFRQKKADMERSSGCRVENILFILPASSNTPEYQSQVSSAAAAAGAHIVLFIERPVLAAAYYDSLSAEQKTVLVFELGGRILEISLITVDLDINVKAAVSDFGCPFFHDLHSKLSSKLEFDFTSDVKALIDIRTECESAKNALCLGSDSVELRFERQGREVIETISRESLVEMNLNLLRSGIMKCLMEAGVEQDAVDEVVLVGASTNIPEVRQVLREFFQVQPLRCEIDPENLIMLSVLKYTDILSDLAGVPLTGMHIADLGVFSPFNFFIAK